MTPVRAQRRKHHIIYKTTCVITGRYYVGMHSTDNVEDGYLGSGTRLWHSINKHGKHNHVREILEHCDSRASLILREEQLVSSQMLADPLCMNVIKGGTANAEEIKALREEAKRKCKQAADEMWAKRKANSEALVAYWKKVRTPEAIAKRAKANTGKKRTEEQKHNLQAGQTRYYSSVDPSVLLERGQKAAITRTERGNNRGGRPKGIPMSETEKLKLGHRMRGNSPLSKRGTCAGCGKETTIIALNRYHISCTPQ